MLRGYQQELEHAIFRAWQQGHQNVLAVMPTGGGKTVVFTNIVKRFQGHVVIIAHRRELISQASLTLAREGIRHSVEMPKDAQRKLAGKHVRKYARNFLDSHATVHVASVDMLTGKTHPRWLSMVKLWIVDEAHHVLDGNKWGKAIDLMAKDALGLGVTATPGRADGKGLGAHSDGYFHEMVLGPTLRELIDDGYLCDYEVACPGSDIDVSGLAVGANGDYVQAKLREVTHKSKSRLGDIADHYCRFAMGRSTIIFAVDIEDAGDISMALQQRGVRAEALSSKTPSETRDAVLGMFERGEVQVLVNVDLFGEGFDVPALDVVIMARHTASVGLYMQQIGRALRLDVHPDLMARWEEFTPDERKRHIAQSRKPRALIIDHTDNFARHRPPDVNRYWSLDRRAKGASRSGTTEPPMIYCGDCTQPYSKIEPKCPKCGAEPLPPAGRRAPETVDGDLVLYTPDVLAELRREIDRIDGAVQVPGTLGPAAAGALNRTHLQRQRDQARLREAMALWAGMFRERGYEDRKIQRTFYHTYGIDMLTAQTLNSAEAQKLNARVDADLITNGVMPVYM